MLGIQILAQYLCCHPGIVGFAKHVAVAGGTGGGVGVGQGSEIESVSIPCRSARGDGDRAGNATKHHLYPFAINQLSGVLGAFVRFARGVAYHQFHFATHDAAGLVDFINGQEGAQTLLQALVLVAAGLRVVEPDFQGFRCNGSRRQQGQ